MTRKVAMTLTCLAILLGSAGCTWTDTKHDFPPSLRGAGHGHPHGPGHVHGE